MVRWPARLCGDQNARAFVDWLHTKTAETEQAARPRPPRALDGGLAALPD
jgi:hypothetical protein